MLHWLKIALPAFCRLSILEHLFFEAHEEVSALQDEWADWEERARSWSFLLLCQ